MEDRICLDTNILIDLLRENQETINLIKTLDQKNIIATTYINLFELYYGAALSENKKLNLAAIDKLLSGLELLNLSKDSIKLAGVILASLKNKGELIDLKDIFIASITIINDFKLLTKNKKHFENIQHLKLY